MAVSKTNVSESRALLAYYLPAGSIRRHGVDADASLSLVYQIDVSKRKETRDPERSVNKPGEDRSMRGRPLWNSPGSAAVVIAVVLVAKIGRRFVKPAWTTRPKGRWFNMRFNRRSMKGG